MVHDKAKPVSWWREVTAQQWLVFSITSTAWLFDILEQRIFSLVRIPSLSALMDLPGGDLRVQGTAKIATALLLAGCGVGGLAGGALGDRYGRARLLTYSITLYAVCNALTAAVQTPDQLIFLLFVTGLSFGAVFGLAVAIITETAPPAARLAMLALLQVMSAVGNVLAAVIKLQVDALAVAGVIEMTNVWRVMFLIGAAPILLAVISALKLRETETWLRLKEKGALPKSAVNAYVQLFKNPVDRRNLYFGTAISAAGIVGLWAIGEYAIDLQDVIFTNYYAPNHTAQATRILVAQTKNWAYILQMIGGGLGMASFGWAAERFGRRATFIATFLACFAITAFAYWTMQSPGDAYWMMPIMYFFQLGALAGFSIYLPELFSARYRGTGVSFAYNLGRFAAAGGSFFSALMTTRVFAGLASPLPLRYSAIVMCSIFLFGSVAAYFAPETKGVPLRD
ncbi:MAG TPA: MFS transporter [Rhizomicrobium sp.]|nr:MFS transporter [Rhizomicrobium sp.]